MGHGPPPSWLRRQSSRAARKMYDAEIQGTPLYDADKGGAFPRKLFGNRRAISHSIKPEVPEIISQVAPGNRHCVVGVIDQDPQPDDAVFVIIFSIAATDPQFGSRTDGLADKIPVGMRRHNLT
ncbi:MAG: hypothetical protein QM492_09275 [Rhodobacterales bacterium]